MICLALVLYSVFVLSTMYDLMMLYNTRSIAVIASGLLKTGSSKEDTKNRIRVCILFIALAVVFFLYRELFLSFLLISVSVYLFLLSEIGIGRKLFRKILYMTLSGFVGVFGMLVLLIF